MDQAKHKAALDALTDLMLSELGGDGRDKFARVNRLTTLASKLQMESARPEDMDPSHGIDMIGDFHGNMLPARGVIGGIGQLGDQAQAVREMLQLMAPQIDAQAASAEARQREAMASELNRLLSARKLAQAANDHELDMQLDKRIKVLAREIAEQESETDDNATDIPVQPDRELRVVYPLALRGHQAREERLLDVGEPRGAGPDGEGSGESVDGARPEPGRDTEAVGHQG